MVRRQQDGRKASIGRFRRTSESLQGKPKSARHDYKWILARQGSHFGPLTEISEILGKPNIWLTYKKGYSDTPQAHIRVDSGEDTLGKEPVPQDPGRLISDEALREYCDRNYIDLQS
ncbi:hypothetical protein Tco_0871196 [Tanacetum coccineum]